MSAVRFQTMPPLATDEYAQLEQSILADGVQVAIITDEHGVVIDGHHRKRIAEQHGIPCPTEVRAMLTDAQKTALSISLNIARRQLSRDQKRAIIEAAVAAQPEKSNREHARSLGVDHKTIGSVRESLESTGEIPQLDKTVGADGRERPATRPAPVETFDADGILVDAATGEVIEAAPVVTEYTVTEKVKTVTGLDGKEYKRPTPKARDVQPVLSGEEADRANAIQTSKAVGQALASLERFQYENARAKFLTITWPTGRDEVQPIHRAFVTPAELRKVAESLITLASEMESQNDYQ